MKSTIIPQLCELHGGNSFVPAVMLAKSRIMMSGSSEQPHYRYLRGLCQLDKIVVVRALGIEGRDVSKSIEWCVCGYRAQLLIESVACSLVPHLQQRWKQTTPGLAT